MRGVDYVKKKERNKVQSIIIRPPVYDPPEIHTQHWHISSGRGFKRHIPLGIIYIETRLSLKVTPCPKAQSLLSLLFLRFSIIISFPYLYTGRLGRNQEDDDPDETVDTEHNNPSSLASSRDATPTSKLLPPSVGPIISSHSRSLSSPLLIHYKNKLFVKLQSK